MRGSTVAGLALVWLNCLLVGVSLGLAYVLSEGLYLFPAFGNATLAVHFWRLDTE